MESTGITLIQAILLGLLYWALWWNMAYTFMGVLKQPLPVALLVGIILGDVPQAMIVGASIQLIYLGMIAPGANIPADYTLAALVGVATAVTTGMDPKAAVTVAVPLGILGVTLDYIRRTANAAFAHLADRYAEEANTRGIAMCALIWPPLLQLPLRAIPVTLALYYGVGYVDAALQAIPDSLLHGLSVAGGIMPALGFAITMAVIGRKALIPYFIAGFFLVQYSGLPIMPIAIFGLILAYLHVLFTGGASRVQSA